MLKQVSIPNLNKGDVRIRMEASGICGTDIEKISGLLGPGGILGHEVSGTIQQVNGANYAVGERVVAHHHVPCYKCGSCMRGDMTVCEQFKKSNIDPGGFAELFRVPSYNVERGAIIRLPSEISFEEASMIEPTACCIRAINKAQVKDSENILVVGLGPTGLTQVQILRKKTSGKIIGTDILESRLKAGQSFGADMTLDPRTDSVPEIVKEKTGEGVDLALVATGNEKALDQAFASVRRGGRILLFGAPALGARYQLDVSSLFSRQISLISSYSCVESDMHEVIRLVKARDLDLQKLVTDRFTLPDAEDALEYASSSKTGIKTLVTASGTESSFTST